MSVQSTPDVCGGEPCAGHTRIPVWVLVRARGLKVADSDILKCYPSLCEDDLAETWAYYRKHREEIDQQIRENEEA